MKNIPLQNSEKTFLVDDEDFERVSQLKWWLVKPRFAIFTSMYVGMRINKFGYKVGKYKRISIQSFILNTSKLVDHKDRNPFNNSESNLRECTYAQNSANRIQKFKNKTSKFKGVALNKALNKWQAKICFQGNNIHLGYFFSEIEAAKAYNIKAQKLLGTFAILNKI